MKSEKKKVRNLVAKYAHTVNRAQVHENKKRKRDLQYWNNMAKSSLADLI